MERRRDGYTQMEVARFLGVHVRTVQRWEQAYRSAGRAGLASKPAPGRRPKLTPAQAREVLSWFAKSPLEFDFSGELWTAPRVAHLIQRRFGVRFHPRYLNAWLTARKITPQKPKRRPRQRDQARIDAWVADEWPRILKKGRTSTPTSS
jgi:transposase